MMKRLLMVAAVMMLISSNVFAVRVTLNINGVLKCGDWDPGCPGCSPTNVVDGPCPDATTSPGLSGSFQKIEKFKKKKIHKRE